MFLAARSIPRALVCSRHTTHVPRLYLSTTNSIHGKQQETLNDNKGKISRQIKPTQPINPQLGTIGEKINHEQTESKKKLGAEIKSSLDDLSKSTIKLQTGFDSDKKLEKDDASSKAVVKKTMYRKIIDEIKHYYHGFKLLWLNVKISSRYVRKIIRGEQLSRREKQQLVRTSSDVFRLVPFSVFIIVPFMELLLPFYLKLFPSMLPSTFQTSKDRDSKIKAQLKVKMDVAKFLQESLGELAKKSRGESHSEEAEKFAMFFEQVRASGAGTTNADILKYSKLFEDEITLDSMTRQQLVACCRLLELQPIGTNAYLRYQLKARLESLKADDELIDKEGVESLTVSELQAACRARGMRALGVPIERLQCQLKEWLDLSLDEKIPASLLLLSRALFVPENISTSEQLKVTIQSLPEIAGTEVEYNINETEGHVDNKTKLEFIELEEAEIQREEKQEEMESFKSTYDEAIIDLAEDVIERAAKMDQDIILKIVQQKSEKNDLTLEFLRAVEHDLDLMVLQKNESVPSQYRCFLFDDKFVYNHRLMVKSFPNRGMHRINTREDRGVLLRPLTNENRR